MGRCSSQGAGVGVGLVVAALINCTSWVGNKSGRILSNTHSEETVVATEKAIAGGNDLQDIENDVNDTKD